MNYNENDALIGVEYHRVLSYNKLFCGCSYKKKESGLYDCFTVHYSNGENHKFKTTDAYCGYQEDHIPPILQRKQLKKAINCASGIPGVTILDQMVFSRKFIQDNSIPAGYQITGVFAYGGRIELSTGKPVFIDKIFLEQDSCSDKHVQRHGLPLLQVSTKPAHLTIDETIEVVQQLQRILNRKYNLPLSAFTRRQDINVSYRHHPKVEIKGVSSLSKIKKAITVELPLQIKNIQQGKQISETKHFNDQQELVPMRIAGGPKRMHLETEIGLIKVPRPSKEQKRMVLDAEEVHLLQKCIANNKEYVFLQKRNALYGLTSNDVQLYANLRKKKKFSFSKNIFDAYLKEECSVYGLRTSCMQWKPLTKEALEQNYAKCQNNNEFFKLYGKGFPRTFKLDEA